MFRIGQRVVCIKGRKKYGYGDESFPAKGSVYTIRAFDDDREDETGVLLVEITNRARTYRGRLNPVFCEPSFPCSAFRPLVDISDLAEIVAEVKRGKPRKIALDRFDKEPAHSLHRSRAPQRAMGADFAPSESDASAGSCIPCREPATISSAAPPSAQTPPLAGVP